VFDDMRQLSLDQVKALEYGRYDINIYHFWMAKLEATRPLTATTNSGVVANGEDASGPAANYYDVLKKSLSTRLVAPKSYKLCFLNVTGLIQSTAPEWMILAWWR
jgi:hypothetical protein